MSEDTPKVEKVKEFVEKFDKDGAVVLYKNGQIFGLASYGDTPELCGDMKVAAEQIRDRVKDGEIFIE